MKNYNSSESKAKLAAVIILVCASVIWGSSFVVVKDSLNYVTPMWQLFYRMLAASLGGIGVFLTQLKYISKKYIYQGIILGVIFAAALIPQNLGASLTTAGKCAFLTVSYVAFTPIIGAVFFKTPLTPKKVLTVFICMLGIGLITLKEDFRIDKGDFYLIITGIAYAFHLIYIDRCHEPEGAVIIHIVQIWTAALIAFGAALITEPLSFSTDISFIWGILYCGIFEVLIGFLLQFKGQQNTSPSLAGIILSSECVFAAIFGVIFQGDSFTLKTGAGCALVFAAAVTESLNFERSRANENKA